MSLTWRPLAGWPVTSYPEISRLLSSSPRASRPRALVPGEGQSQGKGYGVGLGLGLGLERARAEQVDSLEDREGVGQRKEDEGEVEAQAGRRSHQAPEGGQLRRGAAASAE